MAAALLRSLLLKPPVPSLLSSRAGGAAHRTSTCYQQGSRTSEPQSRFKNDLQPRSVGINHTAQQARCGQVDCFMTELLQ